MIVFDELSFANKMSEKGFIKCFSVYELSIYAKFLKYQNKTKEEIEKELILFSKKWNQDFIYDVDYSKIDLAVKSTDEYHLRVPKPVNITENEWNKIMALNDEKYRKVIFVMLVISKYFKYNNTKIVKENVDNNTTEKYKDTYFCNFSDTDILKLSNVRFVDKNERNKMFNYFYKEKYVDITQGKKSIRIVNIVDNNSGIKETITDYNNIILYYERLIGVNIGECRECKRLFRQSKSNNGEYCYFHRGYQPIGTKTVQCIDCGEEVEVDAKDNKTERCNECYEIHRRNKVKENVRRYRERSKNKDM